MVTGIPIEIQIALRHSNPDYKAGYEDGFESAKEIILADLKNIIEEIERLKSYTDSTSTVSTKITG